MENGKGFFEDYQGLLKASEVLVKGEDNPFYKSKYVPLSDVLAQAKTLCVEYNFIFLQFPIVQDGQKFLRSELRHKSGEKIEATIPLECKDSTDPQKVGASLTYYRRYSLVSLFGFAEEDDDGNSNTTLPTAKNTTWKAPGNPPSLPAVAISDMPVQVPVKTAKDKKLIQLFTVTSAMKMDAQKVKDFIYETFKVTTSKDLSVDQIDSVLAAIEIGKLK